jgi:hypothetical protein
MRIMEIASKEMVLEEQTYSSVVKEKIRSQTLMKLKETWQHLTVKIFNSELFLFSCLNFSSYIGQTQGYDMSIVRHCIVSYNFLYKAQFNVVVS